MTSLHLNQVFRCRIAAALDLSLAQDGELRRQRGLLAAWLDGCHVNAHAVERALARVEAVITVH